MGENNFFLKESEAEGFFALISSDFFGFSFILVIAIAKKL
jgi:hypothetical protein